MIYGSQQIVLIREDLFHLSVTIQAIQGLPAGSYPNIPILRLEESTYSLIPGSRSFGHHWRWRNFCQQLELLLGEIKPVYSAARRCQPKDAIFIQQKMEEKPLPMDLDYTRIKGLRLEAMQKLQAAKPASLGQASRISGVSPADISVLVIYLSLKE